MAVFVLPANIQLAHCSFCIHGVLACLRVLVVGEYRKIATLRSLQVIWVSLNVQPCLYLTGSVTFIFYSSSCKNSTF